MFEMMRRVFGPVAVAIIVGAIALVFVFYGVYSPSGAEGIGGSAAATVNGDSIPMAEFSREYNQRTEMFQNMMKGKVDPNLMKQLRIGEQVIEDLIRRRLVLQEADRMGVVVGDAEVREKIKELPYFKDKDGKFDLSKYRGVLEANRYSPEAFEGMMREDLLRGRVSDFVRSRAKVSSGEVEDEFLTAEDRRQVDYVLLTPDTGKKMILVSNNEIDELLKSQSGLDAAKAHYERTKFNYARPEKKPAKAKAGELPKPEFQSFDEVKRQVATDLIRERRSDEVQKINRELAKELLDKAKVSPEALKAAAKGKGLEVQSSQKFNRLQAFVPGIGEMPDLIPDAFKENSPLANGPKMYEANRAVAIVYNLRSFRPDLGNLSKEKEKLAQTALGRKQDAMYQQWMSELRTKAKVSVNKQITSDDEGGAAALAPIQMEE